MRVFFKIVVITVFIAFYFSNTLFSKENNPLWLSNVPPENLKKSVSNYGMHRLCTTKRRRGEGGAVKVIQWIRQGGSVENSSYLNIKDITGYNVFGFSPDGEKISVEVVDFNGKGVVEYNNIKEGYYNIYLIMKSVSGDTLFVDIAKAELLSHSCRNGHKNVRRQVKPKIYPEIIPFELVRERELNENFHFFISSGDEFTYKPMFKGEALDNVIVTLSTEKGWTNSKFTNKKGDVKFQFIQDYFTNWSELHGRKIYYYLIYSEFTKKESGSYNGQNYNYIHYRTSLSDGYFPSRTMYLSLVWGLIVFIVSLIILTVGIYIYRERRKKPYKEYIFDEK